MIGKKSRLLDDNNVCGIREDTTKAFQFSVHYCMHSPDVLPEWLRLEVKANDSALSSARCRCGKDILRSLYLVAIL